MTEFLRKYKLQLSNKDFLRSLFLAFLFLSASLVANFYAGLYAAEKASNYVTDLVLSNTRAFDVDGIFVYGFMSFLIFIVFLCAVEPKRIPFTIKSIALFVFIRSVFISLTHIGPFPTSAIIDSSVAGDLTFGADLFFSSHTGLPFLMALVFWDNAYLRAFFITTAAFFGLVVLLGHLHYSIDVLAAFFITYSIYRIAEIVFKKDKETFALGIKN